MTLRINELAFDASVSLSGSNETHFPWVNVSSRASSCCCYCCCVVLLLLLLAVVMVMVVDACCLSVLVWLLHLKKKIDKLAFDASVSQSGSNETHFPWVNVCSRASCCCCFGVVVVIDFVVEDCGVVVVVGDGEGDGG